MHIVCIRYIGGWGGGGDQTSSAVYCVILAELQGPWTSCCEDCTFQIPEPVTCGAYQTISQSGSGISCMCWILELSRVQYCMVFIFQCFHIHWGGAQADKWT